MHDPLSAWVYFRRNPGKVVPMGFVIVLSVFLIAAVATIVDSVDLTILTIYGYSRRFTYIVPQRTTLRVPDDQVKVVKTDPRTERTMEGSIFFTNIKTVMGQLPFVVVGLDRDDRNYLLERLGARLVTGRMPAEGMPEAVVSQPIAENKRLRIGDQIAGPEDAGGIAGAPVPVRCVGIVSGPAWFAFSSRTFVDGTFLAMPRCLLFTTRDPEALMGLNAALQPPGKGKRGKLDPTKVRVLSYQNLVRELRESLSSLYLIMGIVNGTVIFVIALMSGMLTNIYFTQRLTEFGVLSAMGYPRLRLLRRIVSETFLLTLIGWIVGGFVTYGVLSVFKETLFRPRGLIIDPLDWFAYRYTVPIPLAITVFAVATIGYRLWRLDPVSVIERR